MFIFLLVYIVSFIVSFREVLKGNRAGALIFIIFGLSMYTTAMSVAFLLGLSAIIPALQPFKEILIITTFVLNIVNLKHRPRFHLIDYLILAFLSYLIIYTILPIGEQNFLSRLMALRTSSFYIVVYFTGRFIDPKTIPVNKYFNYFLLLTIAAAVVLLTEVLMGRQLQTATGYADYLYYFFNSEPTGAFGLSTTFETENEYMRFASFFSNPLEHAVATLIALAMIAGLYTRDDNRFNINSIGLLALGATVLSIIFAFSRSPLASYLIMIYVYAAITKRKTVLNIIHVCLGIVAIYLTYVFVRFENNNGGILEIVINTIDFSNPSSVGHLEQWVEGIASIINHPFGIGLGSSGIVGANTGENVGGENQFIIFGVQAGIIALTLYLCVFVMFIKTSLKWLPLLKGKEKKICMTVLLMKIGLIIPLLTSEAESSTYISYINWFLSGILINIIMQPRAAEIKVAHDN